VEEWKPRDPITTLSQRLKDQSLLDDQGMVVTKVDALFERRAVDYEFVSLQSIEVVE